MNLHRARTQLLHRRDELLARYQGELARIDEELAQHPVELVEAANDRWDARTLELVSENDAHALARVEAALRRIDADLYGICEACGGQIAAARLHALPDALRCTTCARLAEARSAHRGYAAAGSRPSA